MAKNSTKSNGKGKAPVIDKNNKRKRQDGKGEKTEAGLSLFGGVKDADLDDVFNKSTALSAPASAPVASSSKLPVENVAEPTSKKSRKQPSPELESSDDEDDAEEAQDDEDDPESEDHKDENEEESEDSSAASDEEFMHESVKAKLEKKAAAKKAKALGKWTPPGETQADRDRRTVFVGNLPIDVAKSKSALHQLRSHLLTFAPTAKIESIRFRSVPFATPTAALPTDDPEKDENQRAKREKERAKAWRSQQEAEGPKSKKRGDDEVDAAKVFIDAKGKRKVAFIKKEFHSELGSCNAYVVFAHPHPDRAANVAPILDPYEAATAVLVANGSSVLDRTIRVDSLRLPSAVALASASNALSKRDAWLPSGTDPKKSLFVGGLDYAAKDEDVRVFFEELIKAERGAGEGKWVTGVRIVRDQQTQLGKGFGYVHLKDRESVEEILAMDQKKIKFAKRYLRVQPCKTLPAANTLSNTIKSLAKPEHKKGAKALAEKSKSTYKTASGPVPKGNPKLGEKIKDLSKEERKAVKSTDADRQARRMAKKKSRLALEKSDKGAVKLGLTRSEKEKTKGGKAKAKKGKIRGPNAIAKMKGTRA
ncbi:hypothetical protein IAR55_002409 [Kwoniella newhampshirensis]|uniref:Nucleolar protein 12 n=1 Tax=Kwoniella newhampshirensis TaxID=1651941 RepID=A0AAW0YZ55_9TREE